MRGWWRGMKRCGGGRRERRRSWRKRDEDIWGRGGLDGTKTQPHFKRHTGCRGSLNKWTTNDPKLGISLSNRTGKHLTAHCRSLNAQETYYHHILATVMERSRAMNPAQLYTNGTHKAAVARQSQRARRQGNICSVSSGRWIWASGVCSESPTTDLAGSGWMFGGNVSHRSQVSMSQTINRCPQTPCGDTLQRGATERSGRRTEQGVWDGGASERGSRPPDTAFHVVISFLYPGNNFINFIRAFCFIHLRLSALPSLVICRLPTCISALYNRSRSDNRETQNAALRAKIKLAPLNLFSQIWWHSGALSVPAVWQAEQIPVG